MARYEVRHGQVASADTRTELTDLGSDGTALDPIKADKGDNSIKELWICPGNEAPTKTACGNTMIFRISGSAVINGPHDVTGHGYCCLATGNTGFYRIRPAYVMPVDIGLKPGDIIIEAAQDGTDSGTPNPSLGLTITSAGSRNCHYETRFATIASLSTSTAMDGVMGGGTKTTISPGGHKKITRIFSSYANELPLATAAGGGAMAKINAGIVAGEFDIVCGAHGSLSTTTGSTVGYYPIADSGPLSLDLTGRPITMVAEQTGVDHGTAMPTVTLEMSP